MRTPVKFASEEQFEQCVESLRSHLATFGGEVPQGDDLRHVMARISGYDSANEIMLGLRASAHREGVFDDYKTIDPDVFIYTFHEHQVMLQGRCDFPAQLWKQGVEGFEGDLERWKYEVKVKHLGMNNMRLPVDVRPFETDEGNYFVATINLRSYSVEEVESAYRMMDHFLIHQETTWPGIQICLRMVDQLILEASTASNPNSDRVLLNAHNALASGKTLADVAEGDRTFMVKAFGEDMGPDNVKMIFGGHRLKMRQIDVKKQSSESARDDKASLAKSASTLVVEDTWRALIQTLSLTLSVYEGVSGRSLSAADFAGLARKHEPHLRAHMTRAFFLGHVPTFNLPLIRDDINGEKECES